MGTNRSTVGGETSSAVTDAVGTQADAADQSVGTDASTMAYVKGISDMLGGSTGFTTFPAAAAAANAVSLAEVARYLSEKQTPRFVTAALTTMETTATTGASPVTIFTVTGDILITHICGVVKLAVTSTSNNGTLELGTSDSTAFLIAQNVADGTDFGTVGDVWVDATPLDRIDVLQRSGAGIVITAGTDITLVVATNSMTAGSITFYAGFIPLSSDGALVSAI